MREEWDKCRAVWEEDRAYRRECIADCRMCNSSGHVWIEDDPGPWYCDHGWLAPPLSSFGTVSPVPPDPNNSRAGNGHTVHDIPRRPGCVCTGQPKPCYFCELVASKPKADT